MSDLVERLQRFTEFYLCQDAADVAAIRLIEDAGE